MTQGAGGDGSGLDHGFIKVAWALFLFPPASFSTIEGSWCLIASDFSFAPRGKRLVHHDHTVGVVCLVEVSG